MNKLSLERRCQIVAALVEGVSIRATCRLTGCSKNTVLKLLVELGKVCKDYQDQTLVNLKTRIIQCDEIWAFIGCKAKNVPEHLRGTVGIGDVWTWTGIDAESKLILAWRVGSRDLEDAKAFIRDVERRLLHRIQLTTDGHRPYLEAVAESFGIWIDYAMLIKMFGKKEKTENRKYSPSACKDILKLRISGRPKMKDVSTSYVERQNLTMRMSMRRFTRLTNAFSRKLENHEAAVAIHFMYYNFARIHQTLRVTPAMEAGIADHPWSICDILMLLDQSRIAPKCPKQICQDPPNSN
ncbi:MAG: DDE-type integrase/transposase/recombinase [Holophagaceae bacterium]|nr:DDE-type integrase/transposase/recombinase [Holophagaceae bacterium]